MIVYADPHRDCKMETTLYQGKGGGEGLYAAYIEKYCELTSVPLIILARIDCLISIDVISGLVRNFHQLMNL